MYIHDIVADSGKRGGYNRETKIGEDGRAIKERHYTDKPNPKYHTNPHDHNIDWSDGFPNPGHRLSSGVFCPIIFAIYFTPL